MTSHPAGRRERLYGWLAGKLIVRAAKLAVRRGDWHEVDHLHAAARYGNTGPGSHVRGCELAAMNRPSKGVVEFLAVVRDRSDLTEEQAAEIAAAEKAAMRGEEVPGMAGTPNSRDRT